MKQFKYAPNAQKPNSKLGRSVDPNCWKHGSDPHVHDSYYAFLKHRSQARFRNEPYDLTFDQWQVLWPEELLAQRGRFIHSLVITRIDWEQGWSEHNVQIVTKQAQLIIAGQQRKKKRRDI